jgi:hypothetical protein
MASLRRGTSVACGLVLAACAPNLADQASKAPAFDRPGEAKCGVAKSQSEPLIVEWPSAARAKLEALSRTGVVAVRYSGCEMEVLASCNAPGKYAYTAITPKHDHVAIRNEDDLYANIPLGAAKLEGKLETSGELDVDMSMVGRYASDQVVVRADQLQGPDCDKATHVVSALTVGAFDFFAGSGATVGAGATVGNAGGGATQQSAKELLNSDGRMKSCDGATTSDKTPPEGCGAILRLEVVPLGQAKRDVPKPGEPQSPTPAAPPPGGLTFEVPDKDFSFNVSVDESGQTYACDKPVTYYQPCHLSGLKDGRAHVKVSGSSSFERDIRVSGDDKENVQVLHRGWGQEIVFGGIAAVGLGVMAFGLTANGGLSESTSGSSSDGGGSGNYVVNLTLAITGGSIGGLAAIYFLMGAISKHDALMVPTGDGKQEFVQSPSPIRWAGPLAPTTFLF